MKTAGQDGDEGALAALLLYDGQGGERLQRLALLFAHAQRERRGDLRRSGPSTRETERYPGDEEVDGGKGCSSSDKYETDDRGTFLNVCPFFEYRREPAGTDFFFPSIIPWRNADFDRIVRPLMTLYEYRKRGDKRR